MGEGSLLFTRRHSHGFQKSNVIFKACAPLNQRNSIHATEDTRHVVRSKIFILFYSNLIYSIILYPSLFILGKRLSEVE